MPENKYMPSLGFQGYVDPYVGAPTKEFGELGTKVRGDYETNQNKYDEVMVALGKVNRVEGDNSVIAQKAEKYKQKLNEVADQVHQGNIRFEIANPIIRSLARDFAADPDLRVLQENYAAVEQQKKIDSELRANGQLARFKDYANFKSVNEDGTYNRYTHDSQMNLPKRKAMEEYFNNMKADLTSKKVVMSDVELNEALKSGLITSDAKKVSTESLSANKIRNQAKRTFESGYLQSAEGRQHLRQILGEDLENPHMKKANTIEEAKDILFNEFVGVGMENQYSKRIEEDVETLRMQNIKANGGGSGQVQMNKIVPYAADLFLRPNLTVPSESLNSLYEKNADGSHNVPAAVKTASGNTANTILVAGGKDINTGKLLLNAQYKLLFNDYMAAQNYKSATAKGGAFNSVGESAKYGVGGLGMWLTQKMIANEKDPAIAEEAFKEAKDRLNKFMTLNKYNASSPENKDIRNKIDKGVISVMWSPEQGNIRANLTGNITNVKYRQGQNSDRVTYAEADAYLTPEQAASFSSDKVKLNTTTLKSEDGGAKDVTSMRAFVPQGYSDSQTLGINKAIAGGDYNFEQLAYTKGLALQLLNQTDDYIEKESTIKNKVKADATAKQKVDELYRELYRAEEQGDIPKTQFVIQQLQELETTLK
jgi:hypothetical protein